MDRLAGRLLMCEHYVSHVIRKPMFAICEQQTCRSACAATQSYQRLFVSCLDRIISILAKSKISRFQIVSVAEQAGLSLSWLQIPKSGFLMTWLMWFNVFSTPTVENNDLWSWLVLDIFPSRKHLRIKVTPDLHLTYSTIGGNLGLVSQFYWQNMLNILIYIFLKLFYTVLQHLKRINKLDGHKTVI